MHDTEDKKENITIEKECGACLHVAIWADVEPCKTCFDDYPVNFEAMEEE